MNTHRYLTSLWIAAALALGMPGCSDDSNPPLPATISVSGNHSVEVGKTVTLTPTTVAGKDTAYTFKSADETIATVDTAGVVTGVKAGETMIEVTGGDTKAVGSHAIVVITTGGGPTGEAVVTISGDTFVQIGATLKLTATTTNATDASYTWASDTETVATVAADGTVTGVASGTAKITATGADSGKTATLTIMVTVDIPIIAEWRKSGHANAAAEAFRHWDGDTPAEVPTSCAKCHATTGYQDYLGADGSAEFVVDKAAAPAKAGIECVACHNDKASKLAQVEFPSGVVVKNLGPEARCMTCHQGRESTVSVNKAITDAALADDDTISATLGFKNIHYFAAGATLFGGKVMGGYQYTGNTYDWRFRHAAGLDTCTGCHNPHSLEIRLDVCKDCHTGITTKDDLKKIRMIDSMVDYDGDGKTDGGLHDELVGLRTKLLTAIQAYATAKGTKICYSPTTYPYFIKDTDGDGTCGATEKDKYDAFTPRLLRAAFNYQVSVKDPGAYAHNAKYVFQLLFDSITDLNTQLTTKVDMTKAVRNDPGHFNGAGEAARHWDGDETVSASCAKCHGGSEGLTYFLQYGVDKPGVEQDNGLDCATCHATLGGTWKDIRKPDDVTFPGGAKVEVVAKGSVSNLCGTCHSGRESTATLDAYIASGKKGFRNVHYLPAAGTLMGTLAKVGYEYSTKTYLGMTTHAKKECTDCHDPKLTNHSFHVADGYAAGCGSTCHSTVTDIETLKYASRATIDYDGSGTVETLKKEHAGMAAKLLTAIQTAAGTNKICYNAARYPYWFSDTDGNGTCEATETTGYASANWTPAMMKAAFNYQYFQKEHGAWAHNFGYMGQLLFDSIEDLGGSTAGMTRPTK